MRRAVLSLIVISLVVAAVADPEPKTVRTRIADGFDQPVGPPDAEGYYMSRGFRPNGHLGEDWNGIGGGNTDIGKPIYSTAHGLVVLARDVRLGWGNVVIIRHVYLEGGQLKMVDSLYGHLDRIMVREGQQITRGQQIGTMGSNRGMYLAHLHFEIRKNIAIGMNRSQFKRDYSNYYSPTDFIRTRRKLPGGGRSAPVPIDTYDKTREFSQPTDDSRGRAVSTLGRAVAPKASPTPSPRKTFRVERFGTMDAF